MGLDAPDKVVHVVCVYAVAVSSSALMLGGRMACWRWRVDVTDAKKAEGASISALWTPVIIIITIVIAIIIIVLFLLWFIVTRRKYHFWLYCDWYTDAAHV